MKEPLHKKASLGSHADRSFPGGVGFWLVGRSPRFAATAVANTLTVATTAIFIDRGDLIKVMGHSYEKAVLMEGRALSRPWPRRSGALQHFHRPWRPK